MKRPPTVPAFRRNLFCVLFSGMVLLGLLAPPGFAQTTLRDLSTAEQSLIHGSSAALLLSSHIASHHPVGRAIDRTYRPNGFDQFMRDLIHRDGDSSTNFIDHHYGGVVTPVAGLVSIALIDIDRHEFSRDVPFYLSGLAATNATTVLIKSIIQRPRPYSQVYDYVPGGLSLKESDHHRSFPSGHTSSAFFAASFVNQRFRLFMRRNWTPDEYRVGRWVSPVVAFGWAGFVGLSRMDADKHYFTDVLAGAAIGAAFGQLYYWLAYEDLDRNASTVSANSHLFMLRFSF